MVKGAVFDMDGLMFDSERLTYEAWQKTMDEYGFDYSFEVFRQTVGKRTVETKSFYESMYGKDFNYDRLRQRANSVFWEYIDKNGMPIKKGLITLLEYLSANHIKISLATSTSEESAMRMIKTAKVEKYFDAFICGNMVKNGKPHPEVFQTAAKALSLSPSDCIALEDSINGIKAAYNAGMLPIMIPDMLKPTEEICPMLYALCDDLSQVIDVIEGIKRY